MAEVDHAALVPSEEYGEGDLSPPPTGMTEVKDAVMYWLLVLLGCGCLFPWMTLVSAVDYFQLRYSIVNFTVLVSSIYTIPLLVFVVLMLPYGVRFDLSLRVQLPFFLFLVLFLAIPALDFLSISAQVAAIILLILIAVMGSADAVVQGTLYALTATLSPLYVQALQVGTGISGVFISSLRVLTKLFFPDTSHGIQVSAYLFFFFAALLTLSCMLAWLLLSRRRDIVTHEKTLYQQPQPSESDDASSDIAGTIRASILGKESGKLQIGVILSKIWPQIVCTVWNYSITLMVFPGILAATPCVRAPSSSWFPVILVTLVNWADCAGKSSAHIEWLTRVIPERLLYIIAVLRAVLVLLVVVCASGIIHEDFTACIITVLFASTNGYIGTRLMMIAPTKVLPAERESVGIIMLFFLVGGLSLGSLLAIPLSFILQRFGIIDIST